MEKFTATNKGVQARQVKARGEDALVYEIETDGQPAKLTTWKKEQADIAAALSGHVCDFTYTAVQKGNYTNYYLDAVVAVPNTVTSGDLHQTAVAHARMDNIPVSNGNGSSVSPDQKYRGRLSNMNGVLQYAAAAGLDQEGIFELFEQVQNVVDGASLAKEPSW